MVINVFPLMWRPSRTPGGRRCGVSTGGTPGGRRCGVSTSPASGLHHDCTDGRMAGVPGVHLLNAPHSQQDIACLAPRFSLAAVLSLSWCWGTFCCFCSGKLPQGHLEVTGLCKLALHMFMAHGTCLQNLIGGDSGETEPDAKDGPMDRRQVSRRGPQ